MWFDIWWDHIQERFACDISCPGVKLWSNSVPSRKQACVWQVQTFVWTEQLPQSEVCFCLYENYPGFIYVKLGLPLFWTWNKCSKPYPLITCFWQDPKIHKVFCSYMLHRHGTSKELCRKKYWYSNWTISVLFKLAQLGIVGSILGIVNKYFYRHIISQS